MKVLLLKKKLAFYNFPRTKFTKNMFSSPLFSFQTRENDKIYIIFPLFFINFLFSFFYGENRLDLITSEILLMKHTMSFTSTSMKVNFYLTYSSVCNLL